MQRLQNRPDKPRILCVTRSYPEDADLYKYPFVHRRILAYRQAGLDADVFRIKKATPFSSHEFEGITCHTGTPEDFAAFAGDTPYAAVAGHGIAQTMWSGISRLSSTLPVYSWLHGTEIYAFDRRAYAFPDPEGRAKARAEFDRRLVFWRGLLADMPDNLTMVFISRDSANKAMEDIGFAIPEGRYRILNNPIDTRLFAYREKMAEDRFNILSIRPFSSATYGNDLAVSAILRLREKPYFERLRFTFVGDGPLFDAVLAPLHGLPNVVLERRFLRQTEIVDYHARHGIFLVPTRFDTQGVSRDEAMSSGLVPVTNAIDAVPEFVDELCAGLAGWNDDAMLATELARLVETPDLFLAKSRAAAAQVRRLSAEEVVIPKEIALLLSERPPAKGA